MQRQASGVRIAVTWNPRTKGWLVQWSANDGTEIRRGTHNVSNPAPLDDAGVRLLVRALVSELESRLPLY